MKGNEASKARHDATFYYVDIYLRETGLPVTRVYGRPGDSGMTFTDAINFAQDYEKRNVERYCKIIRPEWSGKSDTGECSMFTVRRGFFRSSLDNRAFNVRIRHNVTGEIIEFYRPGAHLLRPVQLVKLTPFRFDLPSKGR